MVALSPCKCMVCSSSKIHFFTSCNAAKREGAAEINRALPRFSIGVLSKRSQSAISSPKGPYMNLSDEGCLTPIFQGPGVCCVFSILTFLCSAGNRPARSVDYPLTAPPSCKGGDCQWIARLPCSCHHPRSSAAFSMARNASYCWWAWYRALGPMLRIRTASSCPR